MNYDDGDIERLNINYKYNGRSYRVLAVRESDEEARQLMADKPQLAIFGRVGEHTLLVDKDDEGVPFSIRPQAE